MPTISECLALAEAALAGGDASRAASIYEQILQALPDEANALNGLGVVAYRAGRLDEAKSYHRRAIAMFSGNPAFHNNLNLVYCRQGRPQEAVACCRSALELDPASPGLHNNLGLALKECGRLDEAVESFRQALRLMPDRADTHYNLGNTLVLLHRLDEAKAAFRRAIELAPADADTHNNLGALEQLKGNFADATASFDAALRLNPNFAEAHRNRALLRLLLGDYAAGWPEYEWRWRMAGAARPNFAQPCWKGEPLDGRTILVWCEQGLGDVLQMIRYVPLLRQAGAKVLVQCHSTMHALLQTVHGVDHCLPYESTVEEKFDYYLALFSLPSIFATTVETIPATIPYLSADPTRIEHWRKKLAAITSPSSLKPPASSLKIGLAWQGNPEFTGDYYRSIPLAALAPLADCPGVRLFSLQKGPGHEQLARLAERMRIVDLGATLDQDGDAFVDTAAVMKHLDLVITSDTAIAHLAGALAVPVWVALQYAPNWRWLLGRDDSPWYPTMRLFRQPRFGDWAATIAAIAAELASLSSRRALR